MTARLYLPAASGGEARVGGADLHHLVDVLRLGPGDALTVFDGRGGAFPARILEVGTREARLQLGERRAVEPPRAHVTVVQALCKGEKMDWVVQKSVELGATRLVPLAAERSVVRVAGARAVARVERWRKIAAEAARQCGRADVPEVGAVCGWAEIEAALGESGMRIVLHEGATERLGARLGHRRYAVAIGPEGGFTSSEIEGAAAMGFHPVSLGPRILRTETVALAVLALIEHAAGDLG